MYSAEIVLEVRIFGRLGSYLANLELHIKGLNIALKSEPMAEMDSVDQGLSGDVRIFVLFCLDLLWYQLVIRSTASTLF